VRVEKLFTSRRFHKITVDDVAQAAQVGKGTIYRYFQNKDDFFSQTATAGFDDLCELLCRKVPENSSFFEQLLSECIVYADQLLIGLRAPALSNDASRGKPNLLVQGDNSREMDGKA